MIPPVTDNVGDEVSITWDDANPNGSEIIKYLVEILTSDGEYIEETNECSQESTQIKTDKACSIQMETLTDVPYSLTQGEPIKARVSAMNSQGYSTPSLPSTGNAIAQFKPHPPPDKPIRVDSGTNTE